MKKYRVYTIAKNKKDRDARGLWDGIKDNIAFLYFEDLETAQKEARYILATTTEQCIALEDTSARTLYIISRDNTEVLKTYTSVNAKSKKDFALFKLAYENYTLERVNGEIIAFTYGAGAVRDTIDGYITNNLSAYDVYYHYIGAHGEIKRAYYQTWAKITTEAIIEFYGLPKLPVYVSDFNRDTCFEYNDYTGARALNFNLSELSDVYEYHKNEYLKRFKTSLKSYRAFLLQVILHEIKHYSDFIDLGLVLYNERHEKDRYLKHDKRPAEIGADKFAREHVKEANFFIKEVLRGGD